MKRFFWISGFVLVAGGAALAWVLRPDRSEVLTDAGQIRESAAAAPLRRVLWQPAQPLPPQINSDRDDYEPRVSADGQSLFFVRGKAGGGADIYTCQSKPGGWSEPEPLAGVNSDHDDLGPAPSADGQSLYFYSDRDGGHGAYDLWLARRGPEGWRTPINLGPSVNSPFNDYGPAIAPDGKTLLFASNRPKSGDTPPPADGWSATLREEFNHRDYDLYSAAISDVGFERASPLTALNTAHNEGAPAVSPFGDFLYFSSDRPGGSGGFDLYRSRLVRSEFRQAENLGSAINTNANELDPATSLGGYGLYFSSNRALEGRAEEGLPRYRLYATTSREVFTEIDVAHARIDWSGIWRQVVPNLMWGLLALLLLVLLIALLRDARRRKLSLLARCLIASVAAHLLIMFLLNFWHVTAGVVGGVRRAGRIQVAFSGPSTGGGLASQIRGGLTDVTMPAATYSAPTRLAAPMPVQQTAVAVQLAVDRSARTSVDSPQVVATVSEASPAMPRGSPLAATPPPPSAPEYLDVSLPADATRVAQKEPDSSLAAPAPVDAVVGRLKRVVATSQPAGTQTTVSLQPHSNVPDAALDVESRIATTLIADAVPRLATAQHLPVATALVAAPLGVALPDAPNEATVNAAASEAGIVVSAPIAMSDRAALASGIATGGATVLTATATHEIRPQASSPRGGDSPMTAMSAASSDARPVVSRTQLAAGSISVITEVPFKMDVRLPISKSPGGSGTGSASGGGDVAASESAPAIMVVMPGIERRGAAFGTGTGGMSGGGSATGVGTPSYSLLPVGSGAGSSAGAGGLGTPGGDAGADVNDANVAIGPPSFGNGGSLAGTGISGTGVGIGAGPLELNLQLPTEILPPESPYVQRQSDTKLDITKRMGGSEQTEQAVASALDWLARHQSRNGRWSGGDFDDNCGRCGGQTNIQADVALTGLSLLCFLGAGHTHAKDGPYRETVQRGIDWLLSQQSDDGDLRADETLYSHGIASIALSEAYGMTRDEKLAAPVRRAVRFIRFSKSTSGGWRYEPGEPGDTSVFGWQVMALKSASLSGVEVPANVFEFARAWIDRVSSTRSPGRYAYQPGRSPTRSMTAEAMFALQLLGAGRDEPRMAASAEFIVEQLPEWKKANTYYWYYATLALYQHQGPAWTTWNKALTAQLLPHQRDKGTAAGSWDPVGEWARTGGRVYQTALCTLMLEVYYRYLPLYSVGPPIKDAPTP